MTHQHRRNVTPLSADDAGKVACAKAMAESQRRRDRLHHEFRVAWLSTESPTWGDGTPVSRLDRHNMLRASQAILAGDPYVTGSNTGPQAGDPYEEFLEQWDRERAARIASARPETCQ